MDVFFVEEDFRQGSQVKKNMEPNHTRIDNPKECDSVLETKGTKKPSVKNLREKKRQATQTINWLNKYYCSCPEVCLPREIIYEHYLSFCRSEKLIPACKATFGKLIRNTFPEVTSKRLGARGQSRYHYKGVGIKENSRHFYKTPTTNGITRFSPSTSENNEQKVLPKKFSLTSKVGTLLPGFPDVNDLVLPDSVNKEKMRIFLTMYRMHCQCIVDVTIGGNFEEIRLFLLHFWQGCPNHLMSIFQDSVSLDLIAACDSILHRTLVDVLIPKEVGEVPERLLRGIQNTARHWEKWLQCSLENMPLQLKQVKMVHGRRFSSALKRYVAFLHLAQVSRPVLNQDTLQSLSKELEELEMDEMMYEDVCRIKYSLPTTETDIKTIGILQNLFKKGSVIEALIKWIDDLVHGIVVENIIDVADKARYSILHWVYTLSKISYWMTENKSENFIPFHLLSCLLQEYLLLAFESQRAQDQERFVYMKFKQHLNTSDACSTGYFNSPTSCFLVTNKKQQLSSGSTGKRKDFDIPKRQHSRIRMDSAKHINSFGVMVPTAEQSQSWMAGVPIQQFSSSEYDRNKVCDSDCYIQPSGTRDARILRSPPFAKYNHIYEREVTSYPPETEIQTLHAVNEDNSTFLQPEMIKGINCSFPLSHHSFIQNECTKSDFVFGYNDAYTSTITPGYSTLQPLFNYSTYSQFTDRNSETRGFVT